MNEKHARITADLVMTAAALGAAVIVVRSPKLRRLAWQLARQYAAAPLAAWGVATAWNAWEASDSARLEPRRATSGHAID